MYSLRLALSFVLLTIFNSALGRTVWTTTAYTYDANTWYTPDSWHQKGGIKPGEQFVAILGPVPAGSITEGDLNFEDKYEGIVSETATLTQPKGRPNMTILEFTVPQTGETPRWEYLNFYGYGNGFPSQFPLVLKRKK